MSDIGGQPCPYETCGSSDAFSYNTGGYGKCHSCNTGYPSSRKMFDWAKEKYPVKGNNGEYKVIEQDFTPKDITTINLEYYSKCNYFGLGSSEGKFKPLRGISAKTMEDFGVLTYDNRTYITSKGKEVALRNTQEYIYPNGGVKVRSLDKKGFMSFNNCAEHLFGMNLFTAGGKFVTVTEGELDAMSVAEMLKSGYSNPVVALPNGSPSGKVFDNSKAWLGSFETIILSLDNDKEENKSITEDLIKRFSQMFPNKVRVMDHGEFKDANEFLQAGKGADYKKAWWAARKIKVEGLNVTTSDYLDMYNNSPKFEYFPTGIPELDDKILGVCKGYFTVLSAQTGVGKTELLRYFEYQCLTKSDFKFGFMHLEESPLRSVLGLVSYELDDNLTIDKLIQEKGRDAEVQESISRLTKEDRMIQFKYSPEDGYESLLDQVRFLKGAFDIDYVFFEPIQDLVTGVGSDKENKLADLVTRLSTLCSELNVGVVTIAHQNKEGDTMYCSMIGKKAGFEILLSRDQESEDLDVQNTTHVRVGRKNRVGLGNGPAGKMKFHLDSYTLKPEVYDYVEATHEKSDDIPF